MTRHLSEFVSYTFFVFLLIAVPYAEVKYPVLPSLPLLQHLQHSTRWEIPPQHLKYTTTTVIAV
jgi:hypothetical protein